MLLKRIFLGFLVLLALAAAWRWRHSEFMRGLSGGAPAKPPAAFKFDNGSVRDATAASSPAPVAAITDVPIGGVRKCKKGKEVVYTDGDCPKGTQEHAIKQGTVTVVPAQAAAPKPPVGAEPGQARIVNPIVGAHIDSGPSIREQHIERAAGQ